MLTLAELLQYEPIMIVILILGLIVAIIGAVILTKKEKTTADLIFSTFFILAGIGFVIWFAGFMSFSSITHESITPCNIIQNGNGNNGFVASVEGGTYSASPSGMLKLHLNQTRDVVVANEWTFGAYPNIKEVTGANCPSGAATRC
jgi:drug/metabolite transporter (DMT)-like permease